MLIKLLLLAFTGISVLLVSTRPEQVQMPEPASSPQGTIADFSDQNLASVPSVVQRNEKLRVLNLAGNKLTQIPVTLRKLDNLERIDLSGNRELKIESVLKSLPDSSLVSVDLSGCGLAYIPLGFERLNTIEELDLSGNFLAAFPYDISKLGKLKKLDLRANQFTNLSWCPNFWWSLEELDIRQNDDLETGSLVTALTYLENLKSIKMDSISTLGKDLPFLRVERLEIYDSPDLNFEGKLAQNEFIRSILLDGSLNKGQSRKVLSEVNAAINLNEVKIRQEWTTVPETIGELKSIKTLDLSGNQIVHVANLSSLSGLKNLDLRGNPVDPTELEELKKHLPNCSIVEDERKPIDAPELKVERPFSQQRLPSEITTIDGAAATVVDMGRTTFDIPDNAFLDADGNVVKEPVELEYTEFCDPASIVMSGIPMHYDEKGVRNQFASAGMFEIKASAGGEPVQPNPDNPITVELKTDKASDAYNMYVFDTVEGNWRSIGDDRVQEIPEAQEAMKSRAQNLSQMYQTYDNKIRAFRREIKNTRLYTEKMIPKVKHHAGSKSFTISFYRVKQRPRKELVKDLAAARAISRFRVVYEGQDTKETYKYLRKVSRKIRKAYRRLRDSDGVTPLGGPVFISNVALEPGENGKNYILTINYKDTVLKYPVYPDVSGVYTEQEVRRNMRFVGQYNRAKAREARIDRKHKRVMKFKMRKLETMMRKAGISATVDEIMDYQFETSTPDPYFKEGGEIRRRRFFRNGAPRILRAASAGVGFLVSRVFSLVTFGIINSDRSFGVGQMSNRDPIRSKFISMAGAELEPIAYYYMDFTNNSAVKYEPGQPLIADFNADFSLVLLLPGEKAAVIEGNDIRAYDYNRSGVHIPVHVEDVKGKSTKQVLAYLLS